MDKLKEIGLMIELQSVNYALEDAQKHIDFFEEKDKNGELESVVEDMRRSVMFLLQKKIDILDELCTS